MKTALILSGSLLLSSVALANPIMMVNELSGRVLDGAHVKLTLTTNSYGYPKGGSTHGTSRSEWIQTGSTNRNTGSGVQSLPIYEMCDCHVPTGTLSYNVELFSGPSSIRSLSVTVPNTGPSAANGCVSECQAADAKDASVADAPVSLDVSNEDGKDAWVFPQHVDTAPATGGTIAIDAPMSTGGSSPADAQVATGGTIAIDAPMSTGGGVSLDARPATGGIIAVTADAAIATGGITRTGGTAIASGGITRTGGTATTPSKGKDGGCNFQVPGTTPALPFLALLGLALVGLRRRS